MHENAYTRGRVAQSDPLVTQLNRALGASWTVSQSSGHARSNIDLIHPFPSGVIDTIVVGTTERHLLRSQHALFAISAFIHLVKHVLPTIIPINRQFRN